ncbi:hypothetical protein LJ739_07500 [Aestuariibacter halophilus]|uniref:DUF1648 domain-containing protein n=1 Tax=Fluctibacter halophilus TaxID=226011 RepID=A0ABS8G656_9ALTE|nr:hypothetical protein [Aestuariibacter halophilus]MCC2616082.1 hypothetical protein [Aestuariibacter halophilus]
MSEEPEWDGVDRRQTPRSNDGFYRFVVGINIVAWVVFVVAMVVFHYARPELISGVQTFWGMEGRTGWVGGLSGYLVILLAVCVAISVLVIVLKRQRSRRKQDFLGVNMFILLVVSAVALTWIYYGIQALGTAAP